MGLHAAVHCYTDRGFAERAWGARALILHGVLDQPQHNRADHHPATEKVAQHDRPGDKPEHEQACRTYQVDTPTDPMAFSNGLLSALLQIRR